MDIFLLGVMLGGFVSVMYMSLFQLVDGIEELAALNEELTKELLLEPEEEELDWVGKDTDGQLY